MCCRYQAAEIPCAEIQDGAVRLGKLVQALSSRVRLRVQQPCQIAQNPIAISSHGDNPLASAFLLRLRILVRETVQQARLNLLNDSVSHNL